jgi:hypothetical protein
MPALIWCRFRIQDSEPGITRKTNLNFHEGLIRGYSYEVYRGDSQLYWYDPFPHPHVPELAPTHPHHKHVTPDIKHNRFIAPGLSFTGPNLYRIIEEVERTVLNSA